MATDPRALSKLHSVIIYPRYKRKNQVIADENSPDRLQFPIPPGIQLMIGSDYVDFFSQGMGGQFNSMLNAIGLTASFKWANVQVWKKNTPLQLTLPITLVAYENAEIEIYQQCLRILSIMSPTLPTADNPVSELAQGLGVLLPPGPDLLEVVGDSFQNLLNGVSDRIQQLNTKNLPSVDALAKTVESANLFNYAAELKDKVLGSNQGMTLNIRIGNFLLLKKMILTNAKITFGHPGVSIIPMNPDGFPLKATLSLSFTGTEIWTQNYVQKADAYTSIDGLIDRSLITTGTKERYKNIFKNESEVG